MQIIKLCVSCQSNLCGVKYKSASLLIRTVCDMSLSVRLWKSEFQQFARRAESGSQLQSSASCPGEAALLCCGWHSGFLSHLE